jgi:hypothetical protein
MERKFKKNLVKASLFLRRATKRVKPYLTGHSDINVPKPVHAYPDDLVGLAYSFSPHPRFSHLQAPNYV